MGQEGLLGKPSPYESSRAGAVTKISTKVVNSPSWTSVSEPRPLNRLTKAVACLPPPMPLFFGHAAWHIGSMLLAVEAQS